MEEAVFIKCEPEWLPEAEDISNFQPNVEPPVSELVEIKVDPDLMLPNPDIEEDNLGVAIEEHRYQGIVFVLGGVIQVLIQKPSSMG
ncbi:uncharacterized protein [Anabrus simplex]|uniref:uncharacterized protein isoform X5 n=1 Tax=Anabrus simplex TaxID=316456 RepID=UPI0035A2862E